MGIWELFVIAVGLSADAFAVSICKGLSVEKISKKNLLTIGIYFGGFQALMPLLGFWVGGSFEKFIVSIDHWIAFMFLGIIGANMIKESFGDAERVESSFGIKAMIPMAIATSIDALVVGITFAFLKVDIVPAITFIGVTTFLLSGFGLWIGNKVGGKYKSKAELIGGAVLIIMGLKILLEHLGILG